MPKYNCPLCKQEVSKKLYEEITGIWKEKEIKLKELKEKEKKLKNEAKKMKDKYETNKKLMMEKHQKEMQKQLLSQKKQYDQKIKEQKKQLKEEKEAIENKFQKKLITETNKILREQRAKQKQTEKILKEKFEKQANEKLSKEKEKLQKQVKSFEKQQKLQKNRNERLLKQYKSLQDKSENQLKKADKKIKSLEEQLKKNQTPQVLGLLEEKVFLSRLKEAFPNDKFEHTGKGGDIIHFVYEKNKMVGTLVYELKKVAHFYNSHIMQTFKAKQKREADYGILITNAKRTKDDYGFSISKGVIIIHPAGALVLISILREQIIQISRLELSREERNKTIKAVLEYIRGPKFRNSLEGIIQDTIDLYNNLQKEVKGHIKEWEFRIDKYRSINSNANKVGTNVINLLSLEKQKQPPRKIIIEPIPLPEKID